MYFIDRGSYISNNKNSHCFDSISQLLGKNQGYKELLSQEPRKGQVVVVAPWVQAGNPRQEDPRCPGIGAHGSTSHSHLTTGLPLTQRHPGPAESSLGLAQAGLSPLLCPGQYQVCAPVLVEVMPGFGSAPPRMLPSPSPPPPPAP